MFLFLTKGSYNGDTIAEIIRCKSGYLLKSYSIDDVPCIAFDYISFEDGEEIIKHKGNPEMAFDECGAEEVFRHKYKRIKEHLGISAIVDAILTDTEIKLFFESAMKEIYDVDIKI